jgi:peptide/nickel transport system permease protein
MAVPALFTVFVIVFVVMRLGGDPAGLLVSEYATQEDIAALRSALGLDQPLHVTFWKSMTATLRGDFGTSFRHNVPALPLVVERVPNTLKLTGAALLIAVAISVPLGVLCAVFKDSWVDLFATGGAALGRAIPNFWMGIMLALLFGVYVGWLPVSGSDDGWRSLVMPAFTLGTGLTAMLTRLIRSSLLDVMNEDYVRTARSKGLSETHVLFKHALRNALIPAVTVLGMNATFLLGGAVIVEQVFAWPGIGRLMVQAVFGRDYAIVQAGVMLAAVVVITVNLFVDLLYSVIDPRITRP